MCRQLRDRKSPSGLSRHSFRLIRYHAATATPGGCHVPLPAGRIDGGVSSGSKDASPDKLDRRVRAASWPPYPRPAICSEYKASPIRPRRIGEFRSTGAGSYPRSHDVRSPTPSTIRVRQLEERRSADVIVENLRPLAELSRASVVVRTAERVAAADQNPSVRVGSAQADTVGHDQSADQGADSGASSIIGPIPAYVSTCDWALNSMSSRPGLCPPTPSPTRSRARPHHFDVRDGATLCLKLSGERTQHGHRCSVDIDPCVFYRVHARIVSVISAES